MSEEESNDFATAAAATPSGGVALVTTLRVFAREPSTDAFVELWDLAGNLQWSQVYAGANQLADFGLDVAVDDGGDVYMLVRETKAVFPQSKTVLTQAPLVVLRYDTTGERVWRWERPPPTGAEFYGPDGQIEIVDDRVVVLEHDYQRQTMLFELDRMGNFVSEVELVEDPEKDVQMRDLADNGDVAFAGYVADYSALWATRFDRGGALAWSRTFGSAGDRALAVLAGPSGETYVAWGTDMPDALASVYLQRLEEDGTEAWTEQLPATHPYTQDLAGDVADDGTVLLTGRYSSIVDNPPYAMQPLWVARYGPTGCSAWVLEHEFPEPSHDGQGERVVAAPEGAAFVLATFTGYGNAPWPWLGRIAE